QYAHLARRQTFRYADLPAQRAAIVDAQRRPLVESTGQLQLAVDPDLLGLAAGGAWKPDPLGRLILRRISRLTGVPAWKLVLRIRHGIVRSPYAPAVVVPRLSRDLAA